MSLHTMGLPAGPYASFDLSKHAYANQVAFWLGTHTQQLSTIIQ